jgi:ABC-type polysaccharide/polyol phosphate transport system ATPase subunit
VVQLVRRDVVARYKTYSSGMTTRPAFAVATDVRPDVLMVDEVLSVGDAEFRVKSAARLAQFRDEGTTVLMVSHDLGGLPGMCSRAAWLDGGMVKALGPVPEVVPAYQQRDRTEAHA